ncbi:hypothetical protein [Bradyrhizobium liaoningense]
MLAEKFFLVLESLIRGDRTYPDGSPRVISTSPHVPVKLSAQKYPARSDNFDESDPASETRAAGVPCATMTSYPMASWH